jgi:hypothetical protein
MSTGYAGSLQAAHSTVGASFVCSVARLYAAIPTAPPNRPHAKAADDVPALAPTVQNATFTLYSQVFLRPPYSWALSFGTRSTHFDASASG